MQTRASKPLLTIEPGVTAKNYWSDLWKYRELFYFLAWRDVLVRYKQTAIGIAWALLRPLLTMIILTVIFGKLAKMPSNGIPYALIVMAGMLPWQFFSSALTESSNSLVGNSNLISKIYFPRLIVPASSIIVCLVDLLISLILLIGVFIFYQYNPGWKALTIPAFIALALISALGPGLLITALNVKYRDFRYIIPFAVQFGLYISPVGFATNVVPQEWRLLYSINPVVGVIDGFRWATCNADFYWPGFIISTCSSLLLLIAGVFYFRKMEKTFADII